MGLMLPAPGGGGGGGGGGILSSLGGGAKHEYFPDTVYLSDRKQSTLERFKGDWDEHHRGGFAKVRVISEPDLGKWPKTKDYGVISGLIASQLGGAAAAVHYAALADNGHSVAVREGQDTARPHHMLPATHLIHTRCEPSLIELNGIL